LDSARLVADDDNGEGVADKRRAVRAFANHGHDDCWGVA